MGYSNDPAMVRVDFFKESGKWYATEAIRWTGEYGGDSLIHREFAVSLAARLLRPVTLPGQSKYVYSGMMAVCLEPCHRHAHPITMLVDEIDAYIDGNAYKPMKGPSEE